MGLALTLRNNSKSGLGHALLHHQGWVVSTLQGRAGMAAQAACSALPAVLNMWRSSQPIVVHDGLHQRNMRSHLAPSPWPERLDT